VSSASLKTGLLTLCLSVSLTACATVQGGTSGGMAYLNPLSVPTVWDGAVNTEGVVADPADWLVQLDDPALIALVEEAQSASPNLQRLRSRLDRAEALTRRARSSLRPSVDASMGATRADAFGGDDRSSAALSAGLDISWEPDLWGRTGAVVDAASFDIAASRLDLEAGQKLLTANIAEAWFVAIEARLLSDVSETNLAALERTLGFVTVQYDRGLRSGQDIALIRADVASSRASVERARASSRDALRALEILVGRYPDTDRDIPAALPDVPVLAVTGQPADLLNARPDLKAARSRINAAMARVRSADAARLPNLTLGGVIGGSSNGLGSLLDPASLATTLLSNLTAPIFDGGQRKDDIDIAQADVDIAMADYRALALDAYRDVERQLDEDSGLRAQETALTQALSDARDALKFTQFRYESGENDLLNVLSVQQRVNFTEGRLVSVRRARLVQYIDLALATGY
jgi:NodT family efflux transporter outer membrane factor (OMF) lipoprotein